MNKPRQSDMFSESSADLPIFSGTAPRGEESRFDPQPAARQIPLDLGCAQIPTLVEAAHIAIDRIGDYLGSEPGFQDLHDLQEALDALEDALFEYYKDLSS